MAIASATALPGFNDLGRSVTPIFLLMDHFPYQFSTFNEKHTKGIILIKHNGQRWRRLTRITNNELATSRPFKMND